MSTFLPFIVIGITTGSAYGFAGTGLVLTYKTSGIFNFAHGALGALAVYIFYALRAQHHWPWPAAALVALLVGGVVAGFLLELMARILADASVILKVAATVGIAVAVIALGYLWYGGATGNSVPNYLPTKTFRFLSVNISYEQVIIVLVSLTATAALYVFFRITRLGAWMRAVVDDPTLVVMAGENPVRVRRWAWIIGATFASTTGLLLAPGLGLDGLILTELVIQAFGAAAFGYFSSLPLTYVGGLVIGLSGAIATKYSSDITSLVGLAASLPFIILFVVLLVTPRHRLAERRYVPTKVLPVPWQGPTRIRIVGGLLVVTLLCLVPTMAGSKLIVYSTGLIAVVTVLSLGLLTRLSGQVSLCQYAFVAIGASTMAHLSHNMGIPWLPSVLLAGLIAVPVGAVLAIPAIRLSGVFLGLATLGFGIFLEQMMYSNRIMFGATVSGMPVSLPHLTVGPWHSYTESGFYYLLLLFAVACSALVVAIQKGRLGRILSAMKDSSVAIETNGAAVTTAKVVVFCVSAFLAGIAGALYATATHFASGDNFSSFNSLTLVAIVVIIPFGAPWYALAGAIGLTVIPGYINGGHVTDYLNIFFGVSAIVAPLTIASYTGAPDRLRRLLERLDSWLPFRVRSDSRELAPTVITELRKPGPAVGDGPSLEIRGLTVRYGGSVAVNDLSLSAQPGQLTGLIGPNGAGKTTTFNACNGLVRTSGGEIILHGEDVTHMGPAGRARRGLGRTFQRMELFNSLTVRENIALGYECFLAGGSPYSQLIPKRGDRRAITSRTDRAVSLTGVERLLDVHVGALSTGQRRLVELARTLAAPFDVVLLDEPSSGLDLHETQKLGEILTTVVSDSGIALLLVEHDMSLVCNVCQHVYVMDFGQLIFDGSPVEMLASSTVRAAYLGSEEVELGRTTSA